MMSIAAAAQHSSRPASGTACRGAVIIKDSTPEHQARLSMVSDRKGPRKTVTFASAAFSRAARLFVSHPAIRFR
jgi:hypothetical protein